MMATNQTATEAEIDPKTYTAMNPKDRTESANNRVFRGTARRDTVAKILENGWINGAVCDGRYTDDYKRDAATNFGRGSVSAEHILEKMDITNPSNCWVDQLEDGRQVITIYWSFMSFKVSLDLRNVMFTFDLESDDTEADAEDDEPQDVDPELTAGEVFGNLSEGDKVIWDAKSKPLEVTVGYETAKDMQGDNVDYEPDVWLKGPRGGEKQLRRSERNPDNVIVSNMSMSSRPEVATGFKRIEKSE